jgi:hypothetical protein
MSHWFILSCGSHQIILCWTSVLFKFRCHWTWPSFRPRYHHVVKVQICLSPQGYMFLVALVTIRIAVARRANDAFVWVARTSFSSRLDALHRIADHLAL